MNTCDTNFLILLGMHPASLLPCISLYVLMGSCTLKLFCMAGLGGQSLVFLSWMCLLSVGPAVFVEVWTDASLTTRQAVVP